MTGSSSVRPMKTLILARKYEAGETFTYGGIKYKTLSSSPSCVKGKFDVRVEKDLSGKTFSLEKLKEELKNEILDCVMEPIG